MFNFQINEKQEVIFSASGSVADTLTANNETTFAVETMPEREQGKVLCYNPQTARFYFTDRPKVDEETRKARQAKAKARREAKKKKEKALKWLADNDWKVNKHVLGEWTDLDSRWIAYLADRTKARQDIDDADYIIKYNL